MTRNALPFFSPRCRPMLLSMSFLLLLGPVHAGIGQIPQQTPSGVPGHHQSPSDVLRDGNNEPIGPSPEKLEHMREDDRRKRLLADTAKLVELSNELKSDVEKTSKDQLSLDVVRKAAEIEKLAHDVKERMKS